jgi:hypothetical protein
VANAVAVDKQLDYFSFQFNGKNGVFVLNPKNSGQAVTLGESKLKVSYTWDGSLQGQENARTTINAFTILDDDGLLYKFRLHGF